MSENDAKIEIRVSDNKMKVTANFFPAHGAGEDLAVEDVIERLDELGVNTGINHENIMAMLDNERPSRNILIATAIQPKMGEKARIVPYFDMNERRKAVLKDDGSVDFRDLGEITSAKQGQELYRRVPPTVGEPGKDVFGNEIPGLLGRDLKMVIGPGTERDERDPDLVVASVDGEILVQKGVVQISKVHTIDGDVDYSTGNVKFNGFVKVKGTVKSGFKVEAEGDIEIGGNVEDAEVCGGNDIVIHGGFTGNGDGKVRAARDVILKFIENQNVEADRDIIINGPSYHSNLQAGRSILAKGGKSMIVGGTAEAKNSIEAPRLGSDAATTTNLKVGIDPKLAEKLEAQETELKQTRASFEKIEKSVLFLYRQKIDNKGKLPEDKAQLLEKLEKMKEAIPKKINKIEEAINALHAQQKELEEAFVVAEVAAYPKVKVFFGHQWLMVDDKVGPSRFQMIKGDVVRLSK